MMLQRILITALVSYFLGNHNGAICVSAMLHDDVRSHGSGNAGLTNFIRSYGAGRSAMVIAIDVGKAVLACLLGALVFEPYGLRLEGMTLAGVCVMLGHQGHFKRLVHRVDDRLAHRAAHRRRFLRDLSDYEVRLSGQRAGLHHLRRGLCRLSA